MQRSAGLILLALVAEVALNHIKRFRHAFVQMCRNDRTRLHDEVQHYRPQRVVRVAHCERDIALTGEGEPIGLELTLKYFLVDHDAISCFDANLSWAPTLQRVCGFPTPARRSRMLKIRQD